MKKNILIAGALAAVALLLVFKARAAQGKTNPVVAASIAPPLAPSVALPFGTAGSYDVANWPSLPAV